MRSGKHCDLHPTCANIPNGPLGSRSLTAQVFSPCGRGCSVRVNPFTDGGYVFPVWAGMFRLSRRLGEGRGGFPRVGGDVPPSSESKTPGLGFSPCGRGCSLCAVPWLGLTLVFPVWAGMFRVHPRPWPRYGRFPRVGGDVPQVAVFDLSMLRFSPCGRGCSEELWRHRAVYRVFPVWAGMFRRARHPASWRRSFPRVGGDVPCCAVVSRPTSQFSPCGRGCSVGSGQGRERDAVFPVWAGMFRHMAPSAEQQGGFPRVGGDVPAGVLSSGAVRTFSPCGRGCSDIERGFVESTGVFPVWAGMFRLRERRPSGQRRFPRVGGDVPALAPAAGSSRAFSPCGRGCSAGVRALPAMPMVFPVWAGMFRDVLARITVATRFPRVGGDVPLPLDRMPAFKAFSPCGRGCSARRAHISAMVPVFPVWAGMFRPEQRVKQISHRFPRVGGDVPGVNAAAGPLFAFSPCGRGCSGSSH